jgi:hypothetical protein
MNGPPGRTTDRSIRFSLRALLVFVASSTIAAGALIPAFPGNMTALAVRGVTVLVATAALAYFAGRRLDCLVALSAPLVASAVLLVVPQLFAHRGCTASSSAFCGASLRAVGWAIETYYQAHGSYPPAYSVDATGGRLYSWRASISRFVEIRGFDFNRPWNGRENRKLAAIGQPAFHCVGDASPTTDTTFVAVVGPDAGWCGSTPRTLAEFSDPRTAILLLECENSGINWAEPRDITPEVAISLVRDPAKDGVYASFADGHVEFISREISSERLNAMLHCCKRLSVPEDSSASCPGTDEKAGQGAPAQTGGK